jgi:hypothetical protein
VFSPKNAWHFAIIFPFQGKKKPPPILHSQLGVSALNYQARKNI